MIREAFHFLQHCCGAYCSQIMGMFIVSAALLVCWAVLVWRICKYDADRITRMAEMFPAELPIVVASEETKS